MSGVCRALVLALAAALALSTPADAQRGRRFNWMSSDASPIDYDGRFVIVRLWYPHYPGWSYDYPDMEQNLTLILKDVSALRTHPDGSNIFRMDDPGAAEVSDRLPVGARLLVSERQRSAGPPHLPRQGRVPHRRRLPFRAASGTCSRRRCARCCRTARIDRLDRSHPVFNSFFSIKSLDVPYPGRPGRAGTDGRVLRHPRRQRSVEAADGRHQLQHGHRRLHGAVGAGLVRGRSHQRSLQVRRELLHLRADAH